MITTSSYEQDYYSENEQYEGQNLNDNGDKLTQLLTHPRHVQGIQVG